MKKYLVIILCCVFLTGVFGCGDSKVIDGKEIQTYGLINKEEVRDPNIKYRLVVGNVVWGFVLAETIAAPIYFFGFSIYEPVEKIK